MERLTHKRVSGIRAGYWSPNKKQELVDRLAGYEDTGLDPDQIQGLKDRDTAKPLIERHYEEPGEEPYIKYTCPNGCNIQPSRRSQFCSLCGQRLDWSGENDAVQ